ncbi:hypothetical protein RHGRI_020782 [Rhododendron griersonianum]|uniref:starch synthase n=1 Tax=Rhododendron griersonianum TaxID=479676 RepID=A0AAV6JLJ5_9ERIC|nr:hypothetical protein RHGRI_020782 [Rhododendron griersonianum]
MFSSPDSPYLKTKNVVKVPLDAYMMDFVFSEREDGGIFDNKSGMDYHIPVSGGVVQESPMHIVHIAVEMAPIAKIRKMSARGRGRGGRGMTPHGVTARAVLTPAVSSTPSNDLAQNSSPAPHISEFAQPNVSLTPGTCFNTTTMIARIFS